MNPWPIDPGPWDGTPRKSQPTAAPLERWQALSSVDRSYAVGSLRGYASRSWAEGWFSKSACDNLLLAAEVLGWAAQPRRRVVGWCVREGRARGKGRYAGNFPTWVHFQSVAWVMNRRMAEHQARTLGGRVVAIVERARA
jgi:hypothetical protein